MTLEQDIGKQMHGNLRSPEVLYLALLSAVCTVLPILSPIGGSLLSLLAPFPLITLLVKYPWRYVISFVVLEGIILLVVGQWGPLMAFVQATSVALAMALAIRRGWSISRTIIGSLLVPLGLVACLVMIYGAAVQQWPQELVTRYLDKVIHLSREYAQALGDLQEGEEEQLAALVAELPQLIVTVLPALLVISQVLTNTFNYLLVRRYGQRSHPPFQLDPIDLAGWRASDYLVWVFVASGVAVLIPQTVVHTIGLNVLLLTLAIYLLQGLAIALFWGRRLPVPFGVQCLLIGVLLLFVGPLCVLLCTVAGLFDLWVDFRRQRRPSFLP